MPEFSNRAGFEKEIADYLEAAFDHIKEELVNTFGGLAPDALLPDISQVDLLGNEHMAWVEDKLEEVYLEAAQQYMTDIAYATDELLLSQSAQAWAADRARNEVINTMNTTTHQKVNDALSKFREGGMTNARLIERLSNVVSVARAEMIAITEVTRAAAEGQEFVARNLRQQGIQMTTIWQTLADERVCPICSPRNGQAQGTNWFDLPPAHPYCRCFVTYDVIVSEVT